MIDVEETTVYEEAGVPLNVTELAPVNPDPVILIDVPAAAEVGVKLVIVGTCAKARVETVNVSTVNRSNGRNADFRTNTTKPKGWNDIGNSQTDGQQLSRKTLAK